MHVSRRYGDFIKLHKRLRLELPGKVLPPPPRKNRTQSLYSTKDDSDSDSLSSESTHSTVIPGESTAAPASSGGFRSYLPNPFGGFGGGHKRTPSRSSPVPSPRASMDASSSANLRLSTDGHQHAPPQVLHREEQRVSLRAFLRNFLQNENIANSAAMSEFLTKDPIRLAAEDREDIRKRVDMDEKRMEEQRRFYEIARQRARELDVHMEKFRRDIVEHSEFAILNAISKSQWSDTNHVQMGFPNSSKKSGRRLPSKNCRPSIRNLPNGCG